MSLKKKLPPRKKAVQGRAKQTVKSILEATAHIIERTGMDDLSTNQIAKKAGVSIGSLYQYFPSKESILSDLINNELNSHIDNIKEHISQMEDATLEEFIDEILTTILTMFEKKKRIRYILFKFIPRGLTPKIHEIEDELHKILYEELLKFDELKDVENLSLKAYIIIHSVIGVVHSNLAPGRTWDKDLMSAELNKLVKSYLFS